MQPGCNSPATLRRAPSSSGDPGGSQAALCCVFSTGLSCASVWLCFYSFQGVKRLFPRDLLVRTHTVFSDSLGRICLVTFVAHSFSLPQCPPS